MRRVSRQRSTPVSPSPLALLFRRTAGRTGATLALGLLCLLVYNANLRGIGTGDTLAARYLPFAIWGHGTVAMDPIVRLAAHGHPALPTWRAEPPPTAPGEFRAPRAYWITEGRDGRLASFYPIVAPVLVAPLYLPAVAWLELQGWPPWQVDWLATVMEKLSASLLATLTVLLVYHSLQRDAGRWAGPLAVAFAFGTNTWMISSQALWQHSAGELLVAVALLLVTSPLSPTRCAALGAVCVAMTAARPPDALLAAAFALYALWTARRAALWIVAGAVVPLVLVLGYHRAVFGNLLGGYATTDAPGFFDHPLWVGLAGLLASPMRGLLVFSPFLLFVPVGLSRRLRTPGTRVLAALLAAAVVAQLVVYAKADWRAGTSWGPRWLTDALPILMWMLAPAPVVLRAAGRAALGATIAVAIAIQAIGAFWYTGVSNAVLYASGDDWMRSAWRPANAPFVAELREPRVRDSLACPHRGFIDVVGSAPTSGAGAAVPVLAPGMPLQGWALACGRTPAQALLIADGAIVGHAQQFDPARPDIVAATGSAAPSAWTVQADTAGLAPGEHVLQLFVRGDARGETRLVSETRVEVESPLAALARRAAERLREHQDSAGYWLTAHTVETRFVAPGREMNTFLTAMLVDLLAPVAGEHGLEAAVEDARRHLTAQVEADGLVRYHGLPDGPGMGTLGCPITPDADDSALVWRIAPPPAADARRASMLRVLQSYRDARGLYRTWLAPRERYQCLDPGRDPNPPDVTIQMHVLLMLAELDPTAARSLCGQLGEHVSDEDLWVYYRRAPLVPLLRTVDLGRAGCALEIAPQRLAGVAGQERWMDVARRLVAAQTAPPGGASAAAGAAAAAALLTELGRDEFAALRANPPLLYHNDLTATVPRYYWSEDFGYALWLRLYEATVAAAAPATERSP